MAHYPGAKQVDSPREELPSIFPFSDFERKRRRSNSLGSEDCVNLDSAEEEEEEEDATDSKLRYIIVQQYSL